MSKDHNARVDLGSRSKSEVITIRLNPKDKFGLDLLSRLENRSVAQIVEMSIHRWLNGYWDRANNYYDRDETQNMIAALWSPHRGERFLRMYLEYPNLISYDEEQIWNTLARAGTLDPFFLAPNTSSRELLPNADIRELEECIAKFLDELDIKEQQEQAKKKKEKAQNKNT